jgi:DNA polymerase III delta prime subunit
VTKHLSNVLTEETCKKISVEITPEIRENLKRRQLIHEILRGDIKKWFNENRKENPEQYWVDEFNEVANG